MKLYIRLLKFIRPHLKSLLGAVLFMILFAGMSGFSLTMVIPFTKMIFSENVSAGYEKSSPPTNLTESVGSSKRVVNKFGFALVRCVPLHISDLLYHQMVL